MCGICGVFHNSPIAQGVDEKLLVAMSDAMVHRGPDDSGAYVNPSRRLGFGFQRLSIIDLSSAGHQPMSTADGTVTIVFNGEIYNHLYLRSMLESRGYRYRSRTDTETILYAYQEFGLDFVHKLLGMFALAIWDDNAQRLVLARDRIGVKPLYYAMKDGRFLFASEIKALLQHPILAREFNTEALSQYLTFLVPPAPTTLFKGIFKLEPGHLAMVGSDGSMQTVRYWDPGRVGGQPSVSLDGEPVASSPFVVHESLRTEETCATFLRTLLRQSIKDRMMSDVPFGVFLSGGIDSSTNVALMAELMNRPVETFSVGFKDLEQYNELEFARRTAKVFATNHHEIIIDQRDAFEFLPTLVYHQDEPLADPVCIPLYFVSKLARNHKTIVVQVGEGSDELFAGYGGMRRDLRFYRSLWQAYGIVPPFLRRLLLEPSSKILERFHALLPLEYLRKGTYGEELYWGGAINFTESHKERLYASREAMRPGESHRFARQWHQSIRTLDPTADYLKRMIYVEFMNRLPELLLMRVDKLSMAASVESRVPFLDHRLVEYAMHIPSAWKIRRGHTKAILKDAVTGVIPDDIIHRKKQGFAAPVNEWLRGPWQGYMRDTILNSWFIREKVFNRDFVLSMIERHAQGRANEGQNLWNLFNLVLWHNRWFS